MRASHAKALYSREPENSLASLILAYALHRKGDNEQAFTAIRRAEALGTDVTIMTVAGDICRVLGKFDEAFSYWDRAFEMDSSFCSCLYSKANAYEVLGEIDKAVSEYEGILKWNERQGFTLGVEDRYAREKLAALREQLS